MITVYLDSQDYSALTDPKRESAESIAIRSRLVELANSNDVRFVFSSVAICETVPLSVDSVSLAVEKSRLLVDLCGTNALVSYDRLISMEIQVLLGNAAGPVNPIDLEGNWFPDMGPVEEENKRDDVWHCMADMAYEDLRQKGMSRQQARAATRKMMKGDKPTTTFRTLIESQGTEALVKEFVKKYPMRPEHAELMAQYALGRATETQFREALVASLRDPQWMMRWFATNYSLASPIAEIVRRPGRELGEALRSMVSASIPWADALRILEPDGHDPLSRHGEISRRWTEATERQLIGVVGKLASGWFGVDVSGVSTIDIDRCCPGFTAMIRSLYTSGWDSVNGARKEIPSDSQPVDAFHAIYAPYVDIFRADRFMAPHIAKQVDRHGTVVVPLLSKLVQAIEEHLD